MTTKQTQTLFSLASELDGICGLLEELELLLYVLDHEMEGGCGQPQEDGGARAVWFLRRLPMRRAILHTIQREIQSRHTELDQVSRGMYELYRGSRE